MAQRPPCHIKATHNPSSPSSKSMNPTKTLKVNKQLKSPGLRFVLLLFEALHESLQLSPWLQDLLLVSAAILSPLGILKFRNLESRLQVRLFRGETPD